MYRKQPADIRLRAVVGGIVAVLLLLVAATFPIGLVVANNLGTHVFPMSWMLRPLLWLVAGTIVLVFALRPFSGSWPASSCAAAVCLLGLQYYPALSGLAGAAGGTSRVGATLFICVILVCSVIAGRSMKPPLPTVALVTLTIAVGWEVARPVWHHAIPQWERGVGASATDKAATPPVRTDLPDVYYVIADGFARPDILRSTFGIDATSAIERLRRMGARVMLRSRSNYAQTYLSLASSLSGRYIDPAMAASLTSGDRRPLDRLIRRGELLAQFRALGYEFVMVGSDTTITPGHPLADRCFCPLPAGPTELEYVLLQSSPFGALLRADESAQRAHWAHVRNAFEHISAARSDRPLLVFAHVVAPHPPFVFATDGSFRPVLARFSTRDGDQFQGTRAEYREGYAAQAGFVLNRIVTLSEHLMHRRRRPLVVIHGDHGSGLRMFHGDLGRTDWNERLAIFSLYAGPDGTPPPPDEITPVNALRWAYATVTSTPFVPLENRSFVSSYASPYDLREVPPEPAQ